jgi:O-antigen ligase
MININFDKKNINLYINYFLVGYAFCLPISKAGTNFFEISILLMWLYEGNWKYKLSQYKENPLIVAFALFLGYSLVSVFWASSISYGLDYISKYRHFLMIPVIYTSLDKQYIKHIFSAFIIYPD